MSSSPPDSRWDRSRPRKRDAEVIETAAAVFSERGYDGTSIRDVASVMGLSKGSLYYYARTKEDLLFMVLQSVHGENEQILAEVEAVTGLGPLERIALYVRRQVVFNLGNPERMSVYYNDLYRLGDDRLEAILHRRAAHQAFMVRLIREAQRAGLIDRDIDPRLAGDLVFSTIGRHFRWFRSDGQATIEDVAVLCARYAVGGLTGGPV
jgi:TetR/AcrR family transcriptional regulator, cholesterol catabolism regulator